MKQQLELFKDCDAPCMVFAEVTKSIQSNENVPLSKKTKFYLMILEKPYI